MPFNSMKIVNIPRHVIWKLILGAIITLTLLLLNPSSYLFVGFPGFIVNRAPLFLLDPPSLGIAFLSFVMWLYVTLYLFLFFWVKKFRFGYIIQGLVLLSFFLVNKISGRYIVLNLPDSFILNPF